MVHLSGEITSLLRDWNGGNPESLDLVIDRVYQDLKKVAAYHLSKETEPHTLQPTALVNEVYPRLVSAQNLKFPDRKTFFLFVSELMRRILIEYARGKTTKKRGGGRRVMNLEGSGDLPSQQAWEPADLLALDQVLRWLKKLDAKKHEIVEMWFFAGLDAREIGEVFGRSPITIRRELRTAKCWLARALQKKG